MNLIGDAFTVGIVEHLSQVELEEWTIDRLPTSGRMLNKDIEITERFHDVRMLGVVANIHEHVVVDTSYIYIYIYIYIHIYIVVYTYMRLLNYITRVKWY